MMQADAAGRLDPKAYSVASTGRRFSAWFIDWMVIILIASVAAVILGAWHATIRTMVNDDGSTWTTSTYYLDTVWSYSLFAVVSAVYAIPMWRLRGAMLGQRLLGLRVFSETGPEPLTWPRAAIRWLALYGWAFVGIGSAGNGVLDFGVEVWLLVLLVSEVRNVRNQGIHDRLSNSLVVGPRRGMPSAWA